MSSVKKKNLKLDYLKNEGTWCLLGIAGILPFVVHLYEYSLNVSDESWFPLSTDISTDLFSFYKSIFIYIFAGILLLSCIYNIFTHKVSKPGKQWLLAAFLGLFFVLSGIFSVSKHDSFLGNFNRFETVFVLLSYLIICFASYQLSKDRRVINVICYTLMFVQIPMILIGFLQILSANIENSPLILRLILPSDYLEESDLLINSLNNGKVFLTFNNSNYAAVYISMVMILLVSIFFIGKIWSKILTGIIEVSLLILLINTQSRVGIIMMLVALIIGLVIFAILNKKVIKYFCIVIAAIISVSIGIDAIQHFSLSKRVLATFNSFNESYVDERLSYIATDKEGVKITFNGYSFILTYDIDIYSQTLEVSTNQNDASDSRIHIYSNNESADGDLNISSDINDLYNPLTMSIDVPELSDLIIYETEIDDETFACMAIKDSNNVWIFTHTPENYMIYTGNGKYDTIENVLHLNFTNFYHMASGRFYIWSRALPLLKKYWLVGSGPDTFFRVFPQNDYLGKSIYCSSYLTVVEKPHNLYIMMAIQNGIIALLLMLSFIFIYIKNAFKSIKRNNRCNPISIVILLTIIAFLIGSFFNDSNVCTSPLFFMILGFGIRLNEKQELS